VANKSVQAYDIEGYENGRWEPLTIRKSVMAESVAQAVSKWKKSRFVHGNYKLRAVAKNPHKALPRGKWISAKIRVTKNGTIQARISRALATNPERRFKKKVYEWYVYHNNERIAGPYDTAADARETLKYHKKHSASSGGSSDFWVGKERQL
jgi:hypothetical protein